MYIKDVRNNNKYQLNFSAKNQELRKIDDICRLINREFPVVSGTRVDTFMPKLNTPQFTNLKRRLKTKISIYRNYTQPINSSMIHYKLKILAGMKNLKTANCGEFVHASQAALKINGYKDATICYLYAYNKETKSIKDLDHGVTVVNLRIPKDYKFSRFYSPANSSQLIKPNNNAILCDPWGGFSDYCKAGFKRYKSEVNLFEGENHGDEILLFPIQQNYSEKDLEFIKQKYPELSFSKVKRNDDILFDKLYEIPKPPNFIGYSPVISAQKQEIPPVKNNDKNSYWKQIALFIKNMFFSKK